MKEHYTPGFVYTVETVNRKTGEVVEQEVVHNIMPEQGRNHMLNVTLNGMTQTQDWYLLPYGNDYEPQDSDTAATLPTTAGELTNYAGSTRVRINTPPVVISMISSSSFTSLAATTVPLRSLVAIAFTPCVPRPE